jgi:predicted RNase H-like HicB family nuclease
MMVSDMMEYTATIHREDDHYWAEVDQLPGCFATGDSAGELVEAVSEAISLYLADEAPTGAPVATQVARLGIRVDADPIRA